MFNTLFFKRVDIMAFYYLNGDVNSELKINEDGKLFEWLSDDKDVHNDEIHISNVVLEDIYEQQPDISFKESVLVRYLLFHNDYNGGYVFKKVLKDFTDVFLDKFYANAVVLNKDSSNPVIKIQMGGNALNDAVDLLNSLGFSCGVLWGSKWSELYNLRPKTNK